MATQSSVHTATGIRLRGAVAAAWQRAGVLAPVTQEEALFAWRGQGRPRGAPRQGLARLLEALTGALQHAGVPLTCAMHGEAFADEPAPRASWRAAGTTDAWQGELRWAHPHPRMAGVTLRTQLTLALHHGRLTAALAVGATGGVTGVRGMVRAGQATTPVLPVLQAQAFWQGGELTGTPVVLQRTDLPAFVRDVLTDPARDVPVALLAPLEDGTFLVDPATAAEELVGVAALYVIPHHPDTFLLTDLLGDRRRSLYWGAYRIYPPGARVDDPRMAQWLLMRERVSDPLARAALRGVVARDRVALVQLPLDGVPEAAVAMAQPATPVRAPVPQAEEAPRSKESAPRPADGLPSGALAELIAVMQRQHQETLARLESVEQRLARLEAAVTARPEAGGPAPQVEARGADTQAPPDEQSARGVAPASGVLEAETDAAPDDGLVVAMPRGEEEGGPLLSLGRAEEEEQPGSLAAAVRAAAVEHADVLQITTGAIQAARQSPYRDVPRVEAALRALADVMRAREAGRLSQGLRAAFQSYGLTYHSGIAKTTPARLRTQYRTRCAEGTVVECLEHLSLGRVYDPKACLRIYFATRGPDGRCVVGHVGRHLTVKTTT